MMWWRWTCWRLRARLVDFDAGTLSAAERDGIESHLAVCDRCSAGLAALRDVPPVLRVQDEPAPGEAFWRAQRQSIMETIRGLPVPEVTAPRPHRPVATRPGWMTWAPALVAATTVLAVVALRPEAILRTVPSTPTAEIDGLDDPTLLSLSDLAGVSSPRGEAAEIGHDEAALPELSDDELDALAQLVGAHGR
ncbi:MAG TPA: zf-HC2 domain-containing protein [Candidatus Binatia bacterium]|nr:zf-HC2 domain-containing protein [Candidatus Binatia bacterium]